MNGRAGPTARLAEFVATLDLDQVPTGAVLQAKRSTLDTLGCALQGSGLPWCQIAQRVARVEGGAPAATTWGTDLVTSRTLAAWLNGTAGHAFEFDDVHMGGMFHPGALTVSAAMAVGEPDGATGRTLLAAVVAGTEVGARIGRAVGTQHFLAGFHPQGTVGVFAAAAATARSLGLDATATQAALGIAGSHAAGLMAAQRGAMVKRLHSGHASQSGVQAALLAAEGFTGILDVLEADFGGFASTMGGGPVDLNRLTDGLGERWETEQVAFKPYPSCAAAQASIELARLVRDEHGLSPGDVDRVVLTTSHHVQTHSGWRYRPEGVTAAQMSIGYGVARMLLDGSLEARHFIADQVTDPDVVDYAGRIEVVADETLDALGPDRRYVATIDLTTTDGRRLHRRIDDRPGNTSNPMTDDDLRRKFHSLADPAIGADRAVEVARLVDSIETLGSVAGLAALLRVAGTSPS